MFGNYFIMGDYMIYCLILDMFEIEREGQQFYQDSKFNLRLFLVNEDMDILEESEIELILS